MTISLDNHTLRGALIERGFEDITSDTRSTKSWKLRHSQMLHWVSIKLAEDARQPMAKAPLVIHPDDARKVLAARPAHVGLVFEDSPYKGNSTKYEGGVLGRALSLADMSAVDAFVAAATTASHAAPAAILSRAGNGADRAEVDASTSSDLDPIVLGAAAAEIDAGLKGRVVEATTRQALIDARVGQGRFRKDMLRVWGHRCAVTGCGIETALIASHAIAWRDNKEPEVCLDPYNGLLLTASIDRLFDQGLISFDDEGKMLCKPELDSTELARLGLQIGARLRHMHPQHQPYLAAHRQRYGF